MIRLGIIGTGGMANAHANAFRNIRGVKLAACCDVVEERARAFAEKHEIPEVHTDFREMLAAEKLDAVANVTPDAMHAEVALGVIESGLHILSEKPLATTLEDARKMAAAAQAAGVIHMVNFSYRNSCALQKAAVEVRKGVLGRILHVESSYLQSWLAQTAWGDWRSKPGLAWRLSTRHGSAGVLGDLGCHIYDLTAMLAGDIAEIDCRLKTFDKGVPDNRLGEYVLDANDSFVSTVVFANGALGTVHSSRWATGHHNSLRCRVYGDEGALEIDLDRSYGEYRICTGKESRQKAEWKTVKCPPTPNMYERFARAVRTGKPDPSDFANGARVQAYLDASFRSDAKGGPVALMR